MCSSPLSRALDTAQYIHKEQEGVPFLVIDELKERHWGEYQEGCSSEEMFRIEEHEEQDPSYNPGKGVELRSELKARIVKGILKALDFSDEPVIVSHGRWFLVLCEILNIPLMRQVSNLALYRIELDVLKRKAKLYR